ncbi:MAG TPA: hypothetical protein PLQ19_11540 [Aeromicrobium sp.]|nr:hypothetical protein [Aeromicrobium sp.]
MAERPENESRVDPDLDRLVIIEQAKRRRRSARRLRLIQTRISGISQKQ